MSERVQITMSREALKLVVAMIAAQGNSAIKAMFLAKVTGAVSSDILKQAEREMEIMSSVLMRIPRMDVIEASTADIYAIGVPQSPEANPEYQAALRKLHAEAFGASPAH